MEMTAKKKMYQKVCRINCLDKKHFHNMRAICHWGKNRHADEIEVKIRIGQDNSILEVLSR